MSLLGAVRVPGSCANLGPGFDVLGLALGRYVVVRAFEADRFSVKASGYGSELPVTPDHLGARVARMVLGYDHVALEISSELPLARGMGSSAAVALGVAAALGADDPLGVAVEIEGHPENAAASYHGGAIAAGVVDGELLVRDIPLDSDLVGVVVIPELEIPTPLARNALPESYLKSDAVFNLSRVALLCLSLADVSLLRPGLFFDRIHQDYRADLFPESREILGALAESGALGGCWSGAGSTMIGFARRSDATAIAGIVTQRLRSEINVEASVAVVEFDREGLVRDF